ncbi:Arginase, catabolizes arginine to ornithine and urea [Naganishia albida]|nr:Arginase, catabolizes arginine to ornithine and urea [Naganishia albida]
MVFSLLRQQLPRRTLTTSARRLGGAGVGKAQERPTYRHKFLKEPAEVALVGCPFSGGQARAGVDLGPSALIKYGLLDQVRHLGWQASYDPAASFTSDNPYNPLPKSDAPKGGEKTLVREDPTSPADPDRTRGTEDEAAAPKVLEYVQRLPDPPIGNMKKPRLVSSVCEKLSGVVKGYAERGVMPVTLGGDHSLAMGTIAGSMAAYPEACVIWIDAHADINTPLTTDTGNLHGCPVSFLLGLEGTDVAPFNEWIKPCLRPDRLVYIGLRDVDPAEKRILRENNIKCFTMHDVDKHGIGKVVEMALAHVNPKGERPVHLSFDVDATDPSVAASTGTPVRGGLTFREGHYICEAIAETGCLVALDIMEVNPTLGSENAVEQTVAVGCSLARAALGETLL